MRDMTTYRIIRFHKDEPARDVGRGYTLAEAQAHCQDPETSSATAKGEVAQQYTKVHGPWFDGYEKE